MVVSSNPSMSNVTGDLECSGGVRLNNQRQKLRQRFDIVRKLGQGTYGKVQLATNKDSGEEVAIKTIKKAKIETEQDLVRIQREIQIMSSVQHPHIIHIYEVFENKEKIVLVMEYACGGELYDYLSFKKSLSESEARRIFRQVVSAVFYCHKNKICHRDLKLENILLDEKGNAKIADFGLSNVFDEKRLLDTFCGSPLYASPEIVKGMPYYGPEVDCWSLGVLLYTLVYGAMPFDGSNFRRLVKQISDGDYYEPKKPSDASRLIRRLLTVLPSKRATIEDVCDDWWVNLGYDDCLLSLAEDMCKATPVRLDYLLQLATPAMSEAASGDGNAIDGLSVEEIKSAGKLNTEENLNIQCERSEDSMDTDVTADNKNGDVKKHQLTASERSLSSMADVSAKKRQKTEENENEGGSKDVVEVKREAETELKDEKEVIERVESASSEEEPVPTVTQAVENEESTDVVVSTTAPSTEEDKEKLTIVEVTEEKPVTKNSNEEVKAKPKLRTRSASLKTPDKLNLNLNKDGKEGKKSLVFPALKVSEARRAFETKPAEKRSVIIPGMKVSAARKAFETPSSLPLANNARRASMPAKLSADKTRKLSQSPQPEVETNPTSTTITTSTTTAPTESTVPVKMMGFLPTLDVTMAVKPKKDAGKPPPVPRMEMSPASGTSSGENTPDDVPKPPPHLKLPSPRRSSCPKTTPSVSSSTSSVHDTESRTRTMSESDSLSLNAMTTSSEQSFKSSTSTLTGGDSVETWGSMASVASSKDFGTQSESSVISRDDDDKNEERESTPVCQAKQETSTTAPKVTKVSSMEIKLNSDLNPPVKSQMAEPQLVLRQAPGGGKFTLLGVTSEVTFDVAAAPEEEETCETATVELKNAPPQQKNSNLFMSVTLPPPPPPDGDASSPEIEREKSIPPSYDQTPSEEESHSESRPKQYNRFSSYEREASTAGPGERYFREISKDSEESSHQGYSVYRSKFRSLQKAFLGEEANRHREPSVEHSESFSSTGSTDELEDIFDSLATGDSMLSNILGRTRSIIEEFARDDIAMATRRHSHSLLRRIPGMSNLRSSDFYSKLDSLRNYADNLSTASSSGIGSTRSSRLSRQPPSDHESTASSRNSWRSARTQSAPTPTRDSGPDVESYLNDSAAKSRWYNRSTSREEESESSARSNVSQRRSMYSSNFSRSMSRSISEEDSQTTSSTQNIDAKNDASSSSTSSTSQYHSTHRDSASSLNSQKRSSLSSRFRSGCCPPSSGETSASSAWNSAYSRHQAWSEDHQSTSQEQNKQQYQYSTGSLNRNRTSSIDSDQIRRAKGSESSYLKRESSSYSSGSNKEPSETSSVYGTLRRPKNTSRYGRAATHELLESGYKSGSQDEDSTSTESARPRRPRSLLVLSDTNDDNTDWPSRSRHSERKESTSSVGSGTQQRSSHRSSSVFDDAAAGTSTTVDGGEGPSGDVKKKSEAEFESRSGPNQIPRMNRFGFRRTPSQERTSESASTTQRETPVRDQVPLWRASSHGREIPSTQGGSSSWSRSRFCDDIKPGLVRRASLSEAPPKGKFTSDEKEKLVSPGGAAGYWAKRYGTTSRVPQRRASAGKTEESGEKKGEDEDVFKTFIPRRRSTVGFESDSEVVDELERTRGLLRYARSISHEMDQLQNDLCARFGMINKRKSSQSEEETNRTTTTTTTSGTTKSDVGDVVNKLNKLEDDLLKFGEKNKTSVKSEDVAEESVSESKSWSKTSESESKDEKSISKDEEGSEDGIATPTDMEDCCSICSDYENRSAGGLDESVSERIRRKSYFARFQDRRKHNHGSLRAGSEGVESLSVPVPVRCRHQIDHSSPPDSSNKNKTNVGVEDERGRSKFERRSISAARDIGNGYATLPKSSQKRNHFLDTQNASPNERSVSPETNNNVNGNGESPSSPQPNNNNNNNNNNTKESSDISSDNRDDPLTYRHLRAGSVVPEMMEPGGSAGYSSAKSFLRQRSACDPLRPSSPLSRRLSMLDSSPISNGDIHSSHHLPTGWSSFERRKSRPLASIISSLPLEATVQSRAKLRSRHDYLINRALSTLDERYTRPISPTSRRSLGFHDNHASPPSDLRRFSAILDNASPRDVIRKALDVCNSLQY